jgi:hypothetical protein
LDGHIEEVVKGTRFRYESAPLRTGLLVAQSYGLSATTFQLNVPLRFRVRTPQPCFLERARPGSGTVPTIP